MLVTLFDSTAEAGASVPCKPKFKNTNTNVFISLAFQHVCTDSVNGDACIPFLRHALIFNWQLIEMERPTRLLALEAICVFISLAWCLFTQQFCQWRDRLYANGPNWLRCRLFSFLNVHTQKSFYKCLHNSLRFLFSSPSHSASGNHTFIHTTAAK